MARDGRAVTLLLGFLTVLAIGIAAAAIMFQIRERELRVAKERELLLAQATNQDLEQQLTEVRQAKQQVESDLARLKEQLDQAAKQLVQEREAKDTLAKSVDDRQREIDRLGRDLEQVRSERASLTEQITQLKGQQDTLQTQLSALEQTKTELEAKVLEFSERPSVELDRVVVTGQGSSEGSAMGGMSASPISSVQGQIIVVNREYDFIVMNLGKNQGLNVGQEFQIVRDQAILGRVKVEKVYDELSAAAILPDSNKEAIREGDLVKAL